MINKVSCNYCKPNEYPYYHVCIRGNQSIILIQYDLTFENVKTEFAKYKNHYDFVVIGTLENVDLCVKYVNSAQNNGIVLCNFKKEDIFKSTNPIFVNCTEYFKSI